MPDELGPVEERVRHRFRRDPRPVESAPVAIAALLREEAPLLDDREVTQLARRLTADLTGLGGLEELLRSHGVTDVLVNGPGEVWVERDGRLERSELSLSRSVLGVAIDRLVAPLGLAADRAHPVVDARLDDGTRVSVVLDPVAVDGPVLALRRHDSRASGLHEFGPPDLVEVLRGEVVARSNVVVHGPTGAGKTTLLNALAAEVEPTERVVVIEDTSELRLRCPHQVRLETRPPGPEGLGGVDMAALVRAALRLRPDRIVVGEVRGPEARDMIWALSTGHRGSMSTVHASGPVDALRRLETMVMWGLGDGVPLAAVRAQVMAAVDVLVSVARGPEAERGVVAVHRCGEHGIEALWQRGAW